MSHSHHHAPASLRRRIGTVGLILLLSALGFAFGVGTASAAKTTVNTLGSTATGTTGGLFNTPRGVAVNQTGNGGVAAGTFYVVDSTNNRIQRFSPVGGFVSAWGWGVKDSLVEFEVCSVAANCQKGLSGSNAGEFNAPQGIAVDQSNGNIYVSDQGNRRIDVFGPTGVFEGAFGWGALDGTAALQFCTSLAACHAPGTTAPATGNVGGGQFGAAIGSLAVDSFGKVYVADKTSRRVDVFTPSLNGAVVTGVAFTDAFGWGANTGATAFEVCTTVTCKAPAAVGTGLGQFATNSPTEVAVDSTGNVYALDSGNKRVQEFSSAPAPITQAFGSAALTSAFGTGTLQSLAIDPTANHVYVAGANSANTNKVAVVELDSTGALVETHGTDLTVTASTGFAAASQSLGGNLYLSSSTGGHFVYVLNATKPSIEPVTTFTATTANLTGIVVSNNIDATYHFEYSTAGAGWTKLPASDVDAGTAASTIPVSQVATGLLANTLYRVRLVSNRPLGGGGATSAETSFATATAAPNVTTTPITSASYSASFATLSGTVNANNSPTQYRFEYGTTTEYGHVVPADATLTGGTPVTVTERIEDLQSGTTYHFRIVASSANGEVDGTDQTFTTFSDPRCDARTGLSAHLPDCRSYELVSPGEHNGGDATGPLIQGAFARVQLGVDGVLRTIFLSQARLEGDISGGTGGVIFGSSRTPTGWQVQGFSPKADKGAVLQGITDELRQPVFGSSSSDDPSDPLTNPVSNLFLRNTDGSFSRLSRGSNTAGSDTARAFVGGSSVGTPLTFFRTTDLLVPGMPTPGSATTPWLYESAEGSVRLIGARPDGSVDAYGAVLGNSSILNGSILHNAVSPDASRVVFESPAPEVGAPVGDPSKVYVRVTDGLGTHVVEASKSQNPASTPSRATFLGASPDTTRIVFSTAEQLLPEDIDSNVDLYEYDVTTGSLKLITGQLTAVGSSPKVAGVLGVGNNGRIYLETSGNVTLGSEGSTTLSNIFYYDSASADLTFVASVGGASVEPVVVAAVEPRTAARVTPDGGALLFATTEHLPGIENNGKKEFYLYRAATNAIACVTCGSKPPTAGAEETAITGPKQGLNTEPRSFTTALSIDGSYVFFMSLEPLVPADTNGVLDVYEYHNGEIALLSSGTSPSNSYFLDATPDGHDVLLATRDSLTAEDRDGSGASDGGLYDIYDARIGGGYAATQGSVSGCSGEVCQGSPALPPVVTVPASAKFFGSGNEPVGKQAKHPQKASKKHKKHKKHHGHRRHGGRGTSRGLGGGK